MLPIRESPQLNTGGAASAATGQLSSSQSNARSSSGNRNPSRAHS